MMPLVDIIGIADNLRMVARMQLRDGMQIPPTVFLFARDNPINGEPQDPVKPIVPMVQPPDISKHPFIDVCKSVAVAERAYATIVMFDSWYALMRPPVGETLTGDLDEKYKKLRSQLPPSLADYEDRQSAISTTIELEDGRSIGSHQVYRRDDSRFVFDRVEWLGGNRESRRSVWQLLYDRDRFGEPPAEVMASCRNIAAYMLRGVDWVPADFVPVTKEDEQAQVDGR